MQLGKIFYRTYAYGVAKTFYVRQYQRDPESFMMIEVNRERYDILQAIVLDLPEATKEACRKLFGFYPSYVQINDKGEIL